jgi:hypothetical protein
LIIDQESTRLRRGSCIERVALADRDGHQEEPVMRKLGPALLGIALAAIVFVALMSYPLWPALG